MTYRYFPPRSFGCRPGCNRHLDESACVTAAVGAVTAHETPNETPRCRSARERHAISKSQLDTPRCIFESFFDHRPPFETIFRQSTLFFPLPDPGENHQSDTLKSVRLMVFLLSIRHSQSSVRWTPGCTPSSGWSRLPSISWTLSEASKRCPGRPSVRWMLRNQEAAIKLCNVGGKTGRQERLEDAHQTRNGAKFTPKGNLTYLNTHVSAARDVINSFVSGRFEVGFRYMKPTRTMLLNRTSINEPISSVSPIGRMRRDLDESRVDGFPTDEVIPAAKCPEYLTAVWP
ncbi:hypothetical protein PGT21_007524 [Puccinia graminis f. sp. tritici]|uniref:Uncharacterized protein n=1 Tax=Puccinia graminis f. sp. tritici TaxID=56615 RepID=A0A5B0S8N8_PUCGR|nr:hypothetical protein PGT21_007524 [Puccinia graminis f. sp. tritici]KAA1134182.1 hypothetical protein PGTUg99_031388 [Puccinia graminis f. sp. tritici]